MNFFRKYPKILDAGDMIFTSSLCSWSLLLWRLFDEGHVCAGVATTLDFLRLFQSQGSNFLWERFSGVPDLNLILTVF